MDSRRNKVKRSPEMAILPHINPEWEAQELADSYPITFISSKIEGDLAAGIRQCLEVAPDAEILMNESTEGDGTDIECGGHKLHFAENYAIYSSIPEWVKGAVKPALHTKGHNK